MRDEHRSSGEAVPSIPFLHWYDKNFAANGFDYWNNLREQAPGIFRADVTPPGEPNSTWWYVLSYEHMRDAYRFTEAFSNMGWQPGVADPTVMIPVTMDPPVHTPYRRMLAPYFTPTEVRKKLGQIRSFCRTLVEGIAAKGHVEVVSDFAYLYPTGIFVNIYNGLPMDGLPTYRKLVHDQMATIEQDPDGSICATALQKTYDMFQEVLDARRKEPKDDLPSFLLKCEVNGKPLTNDELLSITMILLRGGLDTVAVQIGHMFHHLARDPALRKRIREEPDCVPGVVEEMLRYYAIATSPRLVTKDCEFAGIKMKAGDRIILPTAAANRDPEEFEHANEFDPDRTGRAHMAFATGVHTCLGMWLAREELRIAIEEWHRLIPDYEVDESKPPKWVITDTTTGLNHLHLKW